MRDDQNSRKRRSAWEVVLVALAAVVLCLAGVRIYGMDPEADAAGPVLYGCGFKRVTGFDCPGCGATRATHYLMHGEVQAAWRMNPLFVSGGPIVLGGGIVWLAAVRRGVRVGDRMVWGFWIGMLLVLLAYWVVRNLAWWPWRLAA